MLIFFIHGVATRDVKYAEPLKIAIKEELKKYGVISPCFFSSFWGNALSDVDKMWSHIDQDINSLQQDYPEGANHSCSYKSDLLPELVLID